MIIAIGIILGIFFYEIFTWAFILFKFWFWFCLPVFVGLPEITFVQAVGLMFVINLFKNHNAQKIKKEYVDKKNKDMYVYMPWATLFLGWLMHLIFM